MEREVEAPQKKSAVRSEKDADHRRNPGVPLGQPGRVVGLPAVIDGLTTKHVEHYVCPACQLLLRDPVQASCGHRFCKRCCHYLIEQGDGNSGKCPIDGNIITKDKIFKDNYATKEMGDLRVLCSSKRYAKTDQDWCQWRGVLRDFEEHEKDCEYVRVACTECGEPISRQSLVTHKMQSCPYRQARCSHCNADMIWKELKPHHENACEEILVPCPNNCTAQPFARKSLEAHLKTCPLQVVNCYYNASGCEFKGPRKDLRVHHDSSLQYHLQLVERTASEAKAQASTTSQSSSTSSKVGKLERSVTQLTTANSQQGDLLAKQAHKITTQEAQLADMQSMIEAMQASLAQLGRTCERLEENSDQRPAPSSGSHKASSATILQRVEENTSHLTRLDRTTALHGLQLSDQSMRQDILEVRRQDGVMLWKISDLERRKQEAVSGKTPSLYSPPFYSSPCGYKMCLRVYLNGDGTGHETHVSLFFAVMRGDFDGLLRWPFQQKVTLMLLSQNSLAADTGSSHIIETGNRMDMNSSSF
eukprot:scpid71365/ scgid5690/ TNF receptor-associated factor 3; CD40 receptor-associated factor 1; TRAFAMN